MRVERTTRSIVVGAGLVLLGSSGLVALSVSGTAGAQTPTVETFSYTGAAQQFVVPADACQIQVDALGASGGEGANPDGRRASGGLGGFARAEIAVLPGETLQIYVGGQGAGRAGGFNGGATGGDGDEEDGGGGGGASDVRRAPYGLADRLVVAGGGGGSGADADGDDPLSNGGDGGGTSGRDGFPSAVGGSEGEQATPPGGGGTQTAGGSAPTSFDATAVAGSLGTGGQGGAGPSKDDAGGGGGGGYYGGGGGAGEDDDIPTDSGGGGGGGSGYGPTGATLQTGINQGDGAVEISYTPGTGCEEIDWTMPERFGLDEDADGMVDYFPPSGNLEIEPSVWQVDLEHGDPTTCDATLSREWTIDGLKIVAGDPHVVGTLDPHSCELSYEFPKEDVFPVEIEVTDSSGALVGRGIREVIVQDWLIVSVGDSVASGEGVPDIPKSPTRSQPEWQSQRCHRAANAGTAVAAIELENADEKTSATFVHLACSGADIVNGLLRSYAGIDPNGTAEPRPPAQIQHINTLIPTREIDGILISIGANDVQFSSVLVDCVIWRDCHLGAGAKRFNRLIQALPSRFDSLGGYMHGSLGALPDVPPDRFYITEYYDPTRYDDSSVCGGLLPDGTTSDELLGDHPVARLGLGVSEAEATWATQVMMPTLNQVVQTAAASNGWNFVTPIRGEFLFHGYCAIDPYVVTYTHSQADQGDEFGTVHPNILGHFVYATQIKAALMDDLYANGDLTKPRLPQP